MSKKKKKQNKGKKGRFTSIEKHKREEDILKTGMSDLNVEMIDWEKDLMPEHIWIDLLAEEYKNTAWNKIYEDFLDRLEETIDKKLYLLGLVSDFGRVPEEARIKFISSNKDLIYHAFYKPIGKILTLYPDNPANWLILDEWKNSEKINLEDELNKLSNSLQRLIPAKDLYAGHIRLLPFTRIIKHKLIGNLPWDKKMVDIASRYPNNCTDEEKYTIQQHARVLVNSQFMINDIYHDKTWPMYFWRHNYNLVPCAPLPGSLDHGDPIDSDRMEALQSQLWSNRVLLMKYLDKIGMQYKYDLYDPTIDEIKLGLFSRIVRLYISFISNPFLWMRDLSGVILRCIGETTIIFFYLIKKGAKEEFINFKNYALGKEKLLMLHLQDNLDDPTTIEGKTIDDIAKDLGGGFNAEIMDIDLKGWTKKNIWQLARETNLLNIYRWVIDPSSAEIHGSWSSIKKSNLVVCRQILHRFHKIPKFYEPPIYLLSLFIAERIYMRCQELGISDLNFPQPDEKLKEIPEIKQAYEKIVSELNIKK